MPADNASRFRVPRVLLVAILVGLLYWFYASRMPSKDANRFNFATAEPIVQDIVAGKLPVSSEGTVALPVSGLSVTRLAYVTRINGKIAGILFPLWTGKGSNQHGLFYSVIDSGSFPTTQEYDGSTTVELIGQLPDSPPMDAGPARFHRTPTQRKGWSIVTSDED